MYALTCLRMGNGSYFVKPGISAIVGSAASLGQAGASMAANSMAAAGNAAGAAQMTGAAQGLGTIAGVIGMGSAIEKGDMLGGAMSGFMAIGPIGGIVGFFAAAFNGLSKDEDPYRGHAEATLNDSGALVSHVTLNERGGSEAAQHWMDALLGGVQGQLSQDKDTDGNPNNGSLEVQSYAIRSEIERLGETLIHHGGSSGGKDGVPDIVGQAAANDSAWLLIAQSTY